MGTNGSPQIISFVRENRRGIVAIHGNYLIYDTKESRLIRSFFGRGVMLSLKANKETDVIGYGLLHPDFKALEETDEVPVYIVEIKKYQNGALSVQCTEDKKNEA